MASAFLKLMCIGSLIMASPAFAQNQTNISKKQVSRGAVVNLAGSTTDQQPNAVVREMPAQGPVKTDKAIKTKFIFSKSATVNFKNITQDFAPVLLVKEMPKQRAEKIEYYQYPQQESTVVGAKTSSVVPVPIKGQSFFGNSWGLSTPNDNDMAISDSGMVVSVINTNIYMRNTLTNLSFPIKSLAAFTAPTNSLHQEFDPKVMYDPKADRFTLVCLVGFVDSTSKVIVGFSQTNDPTGNWNLYTLPGDPLNNNLWTDYPMIAMTEKELFLSVNLLTNNSSWQTGFVESLVWQMKKDSGYAGLPLSTFLHSNIKFNGKAIRNLCPVKGGSKLYSPNMYFLSNRNFASQNDTVFLVNVTDTIGAPSNTVTVKAVVSNQSYYFPPDGRQPGGTQSLATNDSRNLGAFIENNQIQYVHNTNNPANNHVTVYYGTIANPQSANPVATGYILPNDTLDFAYPNISYSGINTNDNSAIITFDHSSDKLNPGCSAMRTDGAGNFSPVLRIQNGSTFINLLSSTQERWGDYSGSQRKYNSPGEVWMSGYYAYLSGSAPTSYRAHGAWIAQINPYQKPDETGISENKETFSTGAVFPNPASDMYSVELNLQKPEYLSFELYDIQGKLVQTLLRDWVKVPQNVFSFRTADLKNGIYILKISNPTGELISKKIVIQK